jgi:5-oxoprolinase (ATP-hydrolysing)
MSEPRRQFWIDVGGTFTDCIARLPDGKLLRHKCLSSGVTKGIVGLGSDRRCIRDPNRQGDPEEFWQGSRFHLIGPTGEIVAKSIVASFDSEEGVFELTGFLETDPTNGLIFDLIPGEEASVLAVQYLLGLAPGKPMPPVDVRLGTTRGTNALLTRQGAATALVTTLGFADVLEIGYQDRPKLFELTIRKPAAICREVIEVAERVTCDGEILRAPEPATVLRDLRSLQARGIESLAICLLHGDRFPAHEELLEELARKAGFREISRSSEVAPLIKIVSRGDTTVVDAYLNPILRTYFARIRRSLDSSDSSEFSVLNSAGGLTPVEKVRGKDTILSGPAGGVVGVSRVAEAVGFQRAIGFDMGGTSTDVSRFDGRFEMEYETEKAGVRIVAPMMAIETVAAGGGSLCWFDGVKLAVGPHSAGADPGPACYGCGGPLAVTDINFFLGRILPEGFPFQLDRSAVESRLSEVKDEVTAVTGQQLNPLELAEGFLQIANGNMAQAIHSISISKGYDPADYLLVAFGGAAPQHACAVAEQLRIATILCHEDAGILSAYGVGMADVVRHDVAGVYRPYNAETVAELEQTLDRLTRNARQEVLEEGVREEQITSTQLMDLRYCGTDAVLTVARPLDGDYAAGFAENHQRLYGYLHKDRDLEVVAVRVEVLGHSTTRLSASTRAEQIQPALPTGETEIFFGGAPRAAQVYRRSALRPGDTVRGPAVVLEEMSTTVVDAGWSAQLLSGRELLIENDKSPVSQSPAAPRQETATQHDPVMLEIFNSHFAGVAEQMGITLRNTASSVNVKERLDFSCALFTAEGDLVANAPHIPVHLGAMGETVKQTIADNSDLAIGDVFVTNDPYRGGSHLPDITVVTPVFEPRSGTLRFFTASRAHHSEIGGIAPGSMSPFSTNLAEEGILIRNFRVIVRGTPRFAELRELLVDGPYPSRSPDTNLADITAQIAANHQGASRLSQLVEEYGWETVAANMRHIQDAAEWQVRRALRKLPDGRHTFVDHLDDGSPLAVAVTIDDDSAWLDFTGTGRVLSNNFNANRAVVTAAVMYCFRCLIEDPIPLNQGVLAPIRVTLPECLLNPRAGAQAEDCPAVAAGNVETSQRVVDIILGALSAAAASQGTMNNVLFGDSTFAYYETICGGAGATSAGNGAHAVQTHMTNTRITDPEVLEQRYPIRVNEFSIRRGSGGTGTHHGGDGIIRRLEFLAPLELSILSGRRSAYLPYGIKGGQPGAGGVNRLRRQDGRVEQLPGSCQMTVYPGDELTVMTPGGGGWGKE